MTGGQRRRRRIAMLLWRGLNPLIRPLAGRVPVWVLLETTGRRSGLPRRVPLARGPIDGDVAWLIAVHGVHASLARNIGADPHVRLRIGGGWRTGAASLEPLDDAVLRRFNRYARAGPRTLGIEPQLVRVDLDQAPGALVPSRM